MRGKELVNSSFLDAQDARNGGSSQLHAAEERIALLKRIGSARNSSVISYLTSIREGARTSIYDSDNRILERHLEMARIAGAKNIDLIINTYGGAGSMGWNFHSLFRDYFPNARLGVFVPYVAYSAGTQICLGCDEVILARSSVLGPADIAAASTISGVLDLINDLDKNNKMSSSEKLSLLFSGENSTTLGELYRYWKEDRRVLHAALRSRKNPLSEKENEKIVKYFLDGVGVHHQGIRRKEVAAAGVSFMTPIEKSGVEQLIAQIFANYADAMKLFNPVIDKTDSDVDAGMAPQVIVESEYETTAAFRSGRQDRDWQSHGVSFGGPGVLEPEAGSGADWLAITHGDPSISGVRKRRR